MKIPSGGSFPYASDGTVAPYTDGILVGTDLATSVYMPTPGELTQPQRPPIASGRVQEYMGNTPCIDTNTTWHAVFAGDS